MKVAIRMPKLKRAPRDDVDPDTAIVEDLGIDPVPIDEPAVPREALRSASVSSATNANGDPSVWVGTRMHERRARTWLVVLLASLAVGAAFVWSHGRQGSELNRLSRASGEVLTQTQVLAKHASGTLAGRPDAARLLSDSRDALGRQVEALTRGDVTQMLPDEVVARISRVDQLWRSMSRSVDVLIAQQRLLESVGAARRVALPAVDAMSVAAAEVLSARIGGGVSARDVAAPAELGAGLQRLGRDLASMQGAEGFDARALAGLVDTVARLRRLIDASVPTDRVRAGAEADTRDAFALLRAEFGKIDAPLRTIGGQVPSLQRAQQAEQQLGAESDRMRAELEGLQSGLQVADDDRRWLVYAAALFGIVGALGAFGLSRAYVGISNVRAEQAERQRLVAENLEQAAKRTNELNQAAILRLMNELQEVADGDLTVQATVSEDITGAIADSVNYTVEELRSLVARINSTAELVNEASSTAQMTATSLQAASEQQSREIKETGESVLRMAQQINDVSARASESVKVARKSLSAADEGSRAVNNAISGMNGIRDQIQETAKRIKRLGESSQEIGEIVELISDITEQTNVLALNAAIQAASAGEAGRGFTIVAEEVQRLAERSAEATKQISALIKTIQTDTQDAVAAMERSTQGVVEGTRRSDEAGGALQDIRRVSQQLAELIEDFSASTSKQAASAGTVAQSIQRILLVTEQTSEGTLQTAGSIRQLSELAQELKNSVSRFKVT